MEILVPMPVVNDLQSGNARDRYPQPTSLSCFAQTALTAGQTKQTKKKKGRARFEDVDSLKTARPQSPRPLIQHQDQKPNPSPGPRVQLFPSNQPIQSQFN